MFISKLIIVVNCVLMFHQFTSGLECYFCDEMTTGPQTPCNDQKQLNCSSDFVCFTITKPPDPKAKKKLIKAKRGCGLKNETIGQCVLVREANGTCEVCEQDLCNWAIRKKNGANDVTIDQLSVLVLSSVAISLLINL